MSHIQSNPLPATNAVPNTQIRPQFSYNPMYHPLNIAQAPAVPKRVQYHILIRNIPVNVQDEFLFSEIKNTCTIQSFKMPRQGNLENKGKCFIEIWNPTPADIEAAKKKLRATEILGTKLFVVDYVEKDALKKIEEEYSFHIDHVPNDVTEEDLERFFSQYGDVFSCELKLADKHSYANLSFKSEDGANKLKDELKDAANQGKISFKEGHLSVEVFKKKDDRTTVMKVYVNLQALIEKDAVLKQLIETESQDQLEKFTKAVEEQLTAIKDKFDAESKDIHGSLKIKEIQVIYHKDKKHAYAYYIFEKHTNEEGNKKDEARADYFAYWLQKEGIYASYKADAKKEPSKVQITVLKLKDINMEKVPNIITDMVEFLKIVNPSLEWKNIILKTFITPEKKEALEAQIYFDTISQEDLAKLESELKEKDIAKKIDSKIHQKAELTIHNAIYTNTFNVNLETQKISQLVNKIQEYKLNDKESINLEVKKITVFKKNNANSKLEQLSGVIEMAKATHCNYVLKNFKGYGDFLRKSLTVETYESSNFILTPYTKLNDILEYKSKFSRPKSAAARSNQTSTPGASDSNSNPELRNSVSQHLRFPPFNVYSPMPHGMPNGGFQNRNFYSQPNGHRGPSNFHQGNRVYNNNYNNNNNNNNNNRRNGGGFNQNRQTGNQRPPVPVNNTTNPSNISFDSLNVIETHITEFNKLGTDLQRNYLGRLVHAQVDQQLTSISNLPEDKALVPRITGMLIDLNVFTIDDIILLLQDPEELKQRITEAKDLINNDN